MTFGLSAPNRARGALLGLAAGDRNGGPVRMALMIARSLVERGRFDAADVGRRYLDWWRGDAFDTGPVWDAVLEYVDAGVSFDEASRRVHEETRGMTAGCNPAHRVVPLAMASFLDDDDLAACAGEEAALTHRHELAAGASAAVAVLCRALIRGRSWDEARELAARGRPAAVAEALSAPGEGTLSSGGFSPDVLRAACRFVGGAGSFTEALDAALEFAGPANFCPVLVGAIGGARWRAAAIPDGQLEHCEVLDEVERLAGVLARGWAPRGRTSAEHPLQIASVPASRGRIGMTFCPGKYQAGAMSGDWDRDLALDLDAVREWGADLVITLLEDHELEALRVPALGEEVERRGMQWLQVPVPDAGVPEHAVRARWALAATAAHAVLGRGGSVLAHCKGGLGRTELAAATLLVEQGEPPQHAVKTVRAARKGAIETDGQLRWVTAARPPADPTRRDRVLGCLLGGAVGDAFGYAVEFDSLAEIVAKHGEGGLREPVLQHGRLIVSDDTQMTMFTAEALMRTVSRFEAGGQASVIAVGWYAYRRWLRTQGDRVPTKPSEPGWLLGHRVMHERRAPGNTCLGALRRDDPHDSSPATNDSKGCGGVMRVAPVGLVESCFQGTGDGSDAVFDTAAGLARLTHGHPTGYLAAGAMARVVADAVAGTPLGAAAEAVLARLARYDDHEETTTAIRQALALAADPPATHAEAVERLGEGWIAEEALAVGLYAALVGRSFADVIRIATNHDGDSDSTASIAGQLYGAANGFADLPLTWVRRLDVLDPLLILGHDLWAVGEEGDRIADYPPN